MKQAHGTIVLVLAAASLAFACTSIDSASPEHVASGTSLGDEVVCPAGPGCWMPDECPDRTVVCPANDAECDASECLAPETCGDRETVCPAGPDCWMPDECPDRTVVCPANGPE